MARDHARLLLRIWDDPDWVTLTTLQHDIYMMLLSSPDLSWCGVAPLLPQRLATLAADLTERKCKAAISALAERRFLITDESTAEVAIRSYVRHDGILKQPNVAKAMASALDRVRSRTILDAIVTELSRHFRDEPEAKGWGGLKEAHPELYDRISETPSRNPSPNPFRRAS